MKNTILFFFLLLAAAVSAQSNSFVTDRLRAAEYFRIGTNTSQKVTGFDRVITAPGTHDSLPTSRAVVDFLEANFTPIGYYTAGTGISISDDVITNSAPDQVVGLTGGGISVITGTYPNFTITSNEVDGSTTNELQNLSLSGQSLSISSGTGVTLPVVGVTAGTGIGVSSSSGNFTVSNTGDLSTTNELNTSFSVSGSNLALTDAGGTINVPVSSIAPVQAVAAGSGISISGTTTRTITAADVSDTNELQTLSIDGDQLTLSDGGGTVTLPGGASDALGKGFMDGSGDGQIRDNSSLVLENTTSGFDGKQVRSLFGKASYYQENYGDGFPLYGFDLVDSISEKTVFFGFTNESAGAFNFGAYDPATSALNSFNASSDGISFDAQNVSFTISSGGSGVSIFDNRTVKNGFEYSADYSANIKTNNRSIPDVGTVNILKQTPVSYTNAAAPNNCIFYSTTDSKLSYKDPGGTVHSLY